MDVLLLVLVGSALVILAAFSVWKWLRSQLSNTDNVLIPTYEAEIMSDDEIIRNLPIPNEWDEQLITHRFQRLVAGNNISLLEYFLKSIKIRLIMGQDDRTAYANTKFLSALVERAGVIKQLRTAYDDLKLYEKELDIKVKKLDIENLELDLKIQDLEHQKVTQQKINALEHQVKVLTLEVQVEELERKKSEGKNPPTPPPTREEERAKNYAESQARISRMKQDKAKDLERMQAEDEEEESIQRREQMWDDAIFREEQELKKWF